MIAGLAGALLLAAWWGLASGAYPERPIRLIVPSTAGSGPDAVGRILALKLGVLLGQQRIS